ncbi:Os10g0183500, partial [Oryza sativa Japonica Group]
HRCSSSRPQACQAAVRSIVLPHPHASVHAAGGNPVQAVSHVVPAAARRQSRSRPHQPSSSLPVAALVNGICHCRSSRRASPHQLHTSLPVVTPCVAPVLSANQALSPVCSRASSCRCRQILQSWLLPVNCTSPYAAHKVLDKMLQRVAPSLWSCFCLSNLVLY